MTPRALCAGVTIAAVLAGTAAGDARAWRLDWEGGLGAATGEYASDARTTTGWLTNALVLRAGPVVLRGSVPVVVQNAATAISSAGLPLPGRRGSSRTLTDTIHVGPGRDSAVVRSFVVGRADDDWRFEPGDPVVSLGVDVPAGDWTAGLSASAKSPVTGTDGFGTGEWDVWAATTIGRRLSASTSLQVSAGYWWFGDPPGIELEDGWTGALRWTRERPDGGALAAFVQGGASPLEGFDPPLSLGIALRRPWSASRAATLSLSVGLSETAAQVLGTAGWTWRLGGE